MTSSRQKKLEKKRKKREERKLKLRKIPQDERNRHVAKTPEERQAYISFIEEDNIIKPTNRVKEDADKKEDIEKINFLGDEDDDVNDRTSETLPYEAKEEYKTSTATIDKKSSSKKRFKNSWSRKWPDSLVDGIINSFFTILAGIVVAIITTTIGYFVIKDKIQELKDDISNPGSIIRTEIMNDVKSAIDINNKNLELLELKRNYSNSIENVIDDNQLE